MNTLNFVILQAQNGGGQAQGGGMSMIIMMVVLFAIVYFLMIRPQRKQQKERQKFLDALEVGQDVVTIGGLHGTIKKINESEGTITLKVATGVEIDFERSAISPKEQPKK